MSTLSPLPEPIERQGTPIEKSELLPPTTGLPAKTKTKEAVESVFEKIKIPPLVTQHWENVSHSTKLTDEELRTSLTYLLQYGLEATTLTAEMKTKLLEDERIITELPAILKQVGTKAIPWGFQNGLFAKIMNSEKESRAKQALQNLLLQYFTEWLASTELAHPSWLQLITDEKFLQKLFLHVNKEIASLTTPECAQKKYSTFIASLSSAIVLRAIQFAEEEGQIQKLLDKISYYSNQKILTKKMIDDIVQDLEALSHVSPERLDVVAQKCRKAKASPLQYFAEARDVPLSEALKTMKNIQQLQHAQEWGSLEIQVQNLRKKIDPFTKIPPDHLTKEKLDDIMHDLVAIHENQPERLEEIRQLCMKSKLAPLRYFADHGDDFDLAMERMAGKLQVSPRKSKDLIEQLPRETVEWFAENLRWDLGLDDIATFFAKPAKDSETESFVSEIAKNPALQSFVASYKKLSGGGHISKQQILYNAFKQSLTNYVQTITNFRDLETLLAITSAPVTLDFLLEAMKEAKNPMMQKLAAEIERRIPPDEVITQPRMQQIITDTLQTAISRNDFSITALQAYVGWFETKRIHDPNFNKVLLDRMKQAQDPFIQQIAWDCIEPRYVTAQASLSGYINRCLENFPQLYPDMGQLESQKFSLFDLRHFVRQYPQPLLQEFAWKQMQRAQNAFIQEIVHARQTDEPIEQVIARVLSERDPHEARVQKLLDTLFEYTKPYLHTFRQSDLNDILIELQDVYRSQPSRLEEIQEMCSQSQVAPLQYFGKASKITYEEAENKMKDILAAETPQAIETRVVIQEPAPRLFVHFGDIDDFLAQPADDRKTLEFVTEIELNPQLKTLVDGFRGLANQKGLSEQEKLAQAFDNVIPEYIEGLADFRDLKALLSKVSGSHTLDIIVSAMKKSQNPLLQEIAGVEVEKNRRLSLDQDLLSDIIDEILEEALEDNNFTLDELCAYIGWFSGTKSPPEFISKMSTSYNPIIQGMAFNYSNPDYVGLRGSVLDFIVRSRQELEQKQPGLLDDLGYLQAGNITIEDVVQFTLKYPHPEYQTFALEQMRHSVDPDVFDVVQAVDKQIENKTFQSLIQTIKEVVKTKPKE